MVEHFDHEGLHQLQNCFVADEDLRGQNILPLTYLLREVLKVPQEKESNCHAIVNTTSATQ